MFNKIKIKKLWDKDKNHVLGKGKSWPEQAIRCAVVNISYKDGNSFDSISFDVFVLSNGTLKLFLPKGTKKMVINDWSEIWTADFEDFKRKVESVFGPLDRLAKESPEIYAHQVLSHGFMEYILVYRIGDKIKKEINKSEHPITLYDSRLKQEYLKWAKANKLPENLLELGWKEYMND